MLNGLVLGQDSVQTVVYHGKIYWFWGDTGWPEYPLGNFHMSGATSLLPEDGGLDPEVGVDLEYFVDDRGFALITWTPCVPARPYVKLVGAHVDPPSVDFTIPIPAGE